MIHLGWCSCFAAELGFEPQQYDCGFYGLSQDMLFLWEGSRGQTYWENRGLGRRLCLTGDCLGLLTCHMHRVGL